MAEVLVQFGFDVVGPDGVAYRPRVCGRARDDGLCEGWIEFEPAAGEVLRTPRETTQPNRDDLFYWATGLTHAYLDGALLRVLRPSLAREVVVSRGPTYSEPAPAVASHVVETTMPVRPRAVLDPFAVYAESDSVLRDQLGALDGGQLRTMILAYDLSTETPAELESHGRAELIALILGAVRERVRPR